MIIETSHDNIVSGLAEKLTSINIVLMFILIAWKYLVLEHELGGWSILGGFSSICVNLRPRVDQYLYAFLDLSEFSKNATCGYKYMLCRFSIVSSCGSVNANEGFIHSLK